MGTPEFAVPTLETLVNRGYDVAAVITAPDKPKGRGQMLATSAVKDAAVKLHIPVLQPTNMKSPAFLEELSGFEANLQIVIAFRMLPEVVWNMPALGTFNLHASLLPQYRGAAPINWAIINGEKETGVTTFFLKHEIDTGDVIFQEKELIFENDNAGSLYERLMQKGAQLALKTVQAIESGHYQEMPQQPGQNAKHAPKIFKETCRINWHQPAAKIYDFIRGLAPYPAAWTTILGKNCKIYKSSKTGQKASDLEPGQFSTDNNTYLHFQTSDTVLAIEELQLEGKKRMKTQDFLRGNRLT